ncbi:MAG: Arsenate reductase thioredoxin-coupled, partial [uncultured Pseudonocardia sp.]
GHRADVGAAGGRAPRPGRPVAPGDRRRPGAGRGVAQRAPGPAGHPVQPAGPPRARPRPGRGGDAHPVRGRPTTHLPRARAGRAGRARGRRPARRLPGRVRLHAELRAVAARGGAVEPGPGERGREPGARDVRRYAPRARRAPRRDRRRAAPPRPTGAGHPAARRRRARRRRPGRHGVRRRARGAAGRRALVGRGPRPHRGADGVRPRPHRPRGADLPPRARRPPAGGPTVM